MSNEVKSLCARVLKLEKRLKKLERCLRCVGRGFEQCGRCRGSGCLIARREAVTCPGCSGWGRLRCGPCHGTGLNPLLAISDADSDSDD